MRMPVLDKNFYPMIKALNDFDAVVKQNGNPVRVTLVAERSGGYNYVYSYDALQDGVNDALNFRIAERMAKTILWVVGGFKISVAGSKSVYEYLKQAYTMEGIRAFDVEFMSGVYERPFEVEWLEENQIPEQKNNSVRVGGYLNGCRIGFDAGGSDRKVSAVINGEALPVERINLVFDFPVCNTACAVAVVPTIITGKFKKWQGFALLAIYASYMALLILNETGVIAL